MSEFPMRYRIHVRDYLNLCRPHLWQLAGLYEAGEALSIAHSIRMERTGSLIGVDVWLVPA